MLLEQVVPDATPPPGARERVRAGIPRRIERLRRRRTIAGYATVLGTAAIAVALASWLQGRGARVDERPEQADVGTPLGAGLLELPSRARVLVGESAAVSLVRDDAAGSVVRVDRGAIVVHVAPRAPGRPFVVLARDVRVEVVGTTFAVAVAEDGGVGVRGYEGVVRVVRGGAVTRVGAGEVWPTQDRAPPIDDAGRAVVAIAEQRTADARAASPRAVLPTTPVVPTVPPSPPSQPRRSSPPSPPAPSPAPVAQLAPVPSPYAAARKLEESGRLAQALAAYRGVAAGPEAEDALYAVARLLGTLRDPEALATFRTYRARYPEGRYARAVDLRLLDAAISDRDVAAIEREATAFLDAHAGDPLAPRFRLARASARIHRGDCAAALADLDHLPRSPSSDGLRASCAQRTR